MKVLLEENETLTQIAYDAGRPDARPPDRPPARTYFHQFKRRNFL